MSIENKRKKSDAFELPWLCAGTDDGDFFGISDTDAKPHYDMNMRNYQASTELPIKSIKEIRQQTD